MLMTKKELQILATQARMWIIDAVYQAKCGHPGGSMSAADMLTYLYYEQLRINPENPKDPNRDRFVLSKGHCAPGLYAVLAMRGFFETGELNRLRKTGALLQGHPDMKNIPGVDMSTGSLGQGFSAATGMALAGKINESGYRVYALLGDGELQEGIVWESAMFAAHNKLDNLIAIVDNNNLQIDGKITEVCSPYPIAEKFAAFGFEVFEIDGHDFDQIASAFEQAGKVKGKPCAVIQKTIKSKGVSFMEDRPEWHGAAPNAEQYALAKAELEKTLAGLRE